jgi:hypothetical protein
MKKALICAWGIWLTSALSGCRKANADAVVKDLLKAEIENVEFAETVRAGKIDWNRLEQIGKRIMDLKAQLANMPKDEVEAAKEKYKDDLLKLEERKKMLEARFPKKKPLIAK